MPSIPTPKSYSQILGTMITAFQATYPIGGMKVGGALLTLMEAAASADFRASMDTLTLIASTSLNSASGTALDRIANDENTQRLSAVSASGLVTVTDSTITKMYTTLKVTTTQAPPTITGTFVYATNANPIALGGTWPNTGSIYIGRGTGQVEGPFAYSGISVGAWAGYKITFAAGSLAKQHYEGETVTLAQAGDRVIPAGTKLQTPTGPTETTRYSVANSVTLLDGEKSVDGVLVSCVKPGTNGNASINSINFVSPPFTGATASNPLPLSNGSEAEDDDTLRDRIRSIRATRSLGTPLALTTAIEGALASDENKTIRSASYIENVDGATIYIDDGNGYEQVDVGVVYEVLAESVVGGDQYFQTTKRPITQCYVKIGRAHV